MADARLSDGPIHVTVATTNGLARRNGVVLHRSPSQQGHGVAARDGIPATHPQRTLQDLRATIEPELEFLALCRRHRLPKPEVNVSVAGLRVDFLWRRERLIVETDGRRFHRGLIASADDRERDRRLERLGYEVLRLSWHQVVHERAATAKRLRARLRERPATYSR